jgi:hypothetical protein
MRKPDLGQIAQVAQIVVAAAVVLSLLYLGTEVRQNTVAIRAAAMQNVAATDAGVLMTLASNSGLARVVQLGHRDPSQLSEADAWRYELYMRQFWLTMQNVYQQSDLGLMDPSVWDGYVRIICSWWTLSGPRDTWPVHREVLSPGFAVTVERCTRS